LILSGLVMIPEGIGLDGAHAGYADSEWSRT
jgi:hypothetical protein